MTTTSPFHRAIAKNRTKTVRLMMEAGEKPDSLACCYAIQHRAHGILRLLINAGADLNKIEAYWGYTPLIRALLSQNLSAFKILVSSGASINRNGLAGAPLHYAAEKGYIPGARLCIASGAQLDQRDPAGNTPLMLAASMGRLSVVKLLLRAGANPLALNAAGRTSCELAAENGEKQIVSVLTPCSARRPLQRRGIALLIQAVSDRDMARIESCLRTGLDLDLRDRFGRSPLDKAIQLGSLPIVKRLVSSGLSLNKVGPDGLSFLELALRQGELQIARFLLQAGASPNPPGNRVGDALYTVCAIGNVEILNILLKLGSQPKKPDALISAARKKSIELIKLLLKAGAPVDGVDGMGWTPLTWAVFDVLHAGQQITSPQQRVRFVAPTVIDTTRDKATIQSVKVLVEAGANVNHLNNDGRPPLSYANSVETAKYLIKVGARLDIRDLSGKSVTDWMTTNAVSKAITPSYRHKKKKR